MKLLIIPIAPLFLLAAIDWTGNGGSAPPSLLLAANFLGRTLLPLLVILLLFICLRTRRC